MKSFSSKKTSKNFIKTIFRALKSLTALFGSGWVNTYSIYRNRVCAITYTRATLLSAFVTLVIVFTPHVESQFNFTRKLETLNVIPGSVVGNDWRNTHALYVQDVKKDDLYQSFTEANSAYPERTSPEASRNGAPDTQSDTPSEENIVTPTETDGGATDQTPDQSDVVPQEDVPAETTPDPIETGTDVSTPPPTQSTEPISVHDTNAVFGFFKAVRDMLPFAQESITTETVENPVPSAPEALPTPNETQIDTAATEAVPAVETTTAAEISTGEVESETVPEVVQPAEVSVSEAVTTSATPQSAETNTAPTHEPLVFSDFAIPALNSGQFITNVQLRASLGALVAHQDGVPQPTLVFEYSFDDSWQEMGSVILDGEVSNALNGGYFLFALPAVTNPAVLHDLKIRVRAEGDLQKDDRVYIDAVWLEVDTEVFDRALLRERLLPAALEGLELPKMHEILSDTLDFTREDNPLFVLRYESQRNAAIRFIRNVLGRNLAEVQSVTFIRKGVGVIPVVPIIDATSDGLWTIQIPKEAQDDMEPGTYTIEITVDEGGKFFTDSFDFQWGLLAVNPNKTEYNEGEVATIALAALSPDGNTLCGADLSLYIIDPSDFIYKTPVQPSGLCNGNNVIDVPDYSALFTPTVPGTYQMYVEHLGPNGEVRAHTTDTFMVRANQTLSIERSGQTRINPRSLYNMSLTVKSEQGYTGVLTERVPADFMVTGTDGAISAVSGGQEISWNIDLLPGATKTVSYSYDAPDISPYLYALGPASLSGTPDTVAPSPVSTTAADVPSALTGNPTGNIDTNTTSGTSTVESVGGNTGSEPLPAPAGEVVPDVVPTVDTPDPVVIPDPVPAPVSDSLPVPDAPITDTPTAPEAFERLRNAAPMAAEVITTTATTSESTTAFTEHRAWQLASDATGSMIVFWTDGASIPAGWTCISCAATSTFYQRFPLGGATYGTQGGVPTTTHTADGTVNQATGANTENNSTNAVNIEAHTHTITPVVGSTTTLPAYRGLRVIQNNSAGTPATIPAGAVLVFDSALPSGWAQYSALDNRYPYGGNTITSGGSNTHIHSVTGTTSAAGGTTVLARTSGTTVTAAQSTHTHTLSTTTAPVNLEPPYIEVIFATSSTATATPLSAIALWSDTPPAGWLDRSSTDAKPFYNRYIKGAATYGTTGGAETHTHANFTASSSAPVGTATRRQGAVGANGTHAHLIDVQNFSTASNTPPYVTVIYAKYYGLIPIYEQTAFRWYANATTTTVTDPWPLGTADVDESQAIDETLTPLKNGDIVRLRLQLNVQNSTTTGESFTLQYGTTTSVCTAVSAWADVGAATSSAPWTGYNNSGLADGATISSSTLTGTNVFESYEEANPTEILPNEIGIGQNGEWDFVLKQNNASPATNYCFRVVESDGTELFTYTQYPMLITDAVPNAPTLDVPFNNEKVSTTTPHFEFSGTDPEADDLTYQIQIDDDSTFASVNVDRNTASNPTQFANLTTPSDKDPYNQGESIRFSLPVASALTNGTTYYWRVRTSDPNGSNNSGSWSDIQSFTVDTTVTVSTWFQTTEEQFDTDTLVGTDALVTDRLELASGSTTGTTTSSQINFLDGTVGNAWGSLSWTDDETVGDIKYRVQYFNESSQAWEYVSDQVLSGNSTGFDTSPVSLLGLDTDTYGLLRLVAVFTNIGGSPILYDWTVSWGYRIETVTQVALFPNEKTGTTTPSFIFSTSDPQGDALVYEVQWSTTYDFAASTTRSSDVHGGFVNSTNGGNSSPFTSGDTIRFTIQPADALTNGTTYWWRVRARDPLGSNQYSLNTEPRSFTVDTTVTVSTWFETTQSQFDTNVLSGTLSLAAGSVTVATTSDESLIVYAEGNITTPRYREWSGTAWSAESSALDVGATINWIVTRSSPIANEYITGTLGTDADVNVQVFTNGSWSDLQEITTSMPNTNMRGFDIAYEQTSGDALVVSCDGDADPVYYVWDGATWTNGGGLNRVNANTCGWVKLVSDPGSDEIIAVIRDTSGVRYEARVWDGSAWGNSATLGSMNQTAHEGIAVEYEDSGDQAVVVTSNGTAASFAWRAWNGATWTATTTQTLGDDFEAGSIAKDEGTDNMVLCYVDEDGDIGTVRWSGSAWQIVPALFTELDTAWTTASGVYNDRPIECAYEEGGARDGYVMAAYATTTGMAYRAWDGATWSAALTLASIQDAPRVQLRRTGANLLQMVAYDNTNDRYDYSGWNGTSWSTFQTLETDASVGASPYKEPFMVAKRKPGIIGSAVVSPPIDFNDGSGPYWDQFSWTDAEPGGSTILYQIEYWNGTSWELVPDALIPGNAAGNTTSPIDLSNVLPVSVYNELRPVANLTCSLGICPTLSDWTVTWAAGITVSGTIQGYDQSTNVTSGAVAIALNGVLQVGKTGAIAGGAWSISNVNAMPGDVVTVFVSGANDANEAVGVARYDGVGDITGMTLFERHLVMGSDDATSTPFTNADLGLYDTTNDENLFFDVSGTSLAICGDVGCGDAELYIKSGATYRPAGLVNTHDIEINGTFTPDGNTVYVSGSWDNNGTSTSATSTTIFSATSTTETINETGALAPSFFNLTFGTTTGSATWNVETALDINGALAITRGTVLRGGIALTVAGNATIGANGFISGVGTTTFDGTGTSVFVDQNSIPQNIGYTVVNGTSKTLQLGSALRAQSITIGSDDILDVSTSNYGLTVLADFINNNTFVARSGTTTFAGTTTNLSITAGASAFYNLAFTGAGGAWSFTDTNLTVSNDFNIATGTVTLPSGTTTISGAFLNSGGTFVHNNGTVAMTASGAKAVQQSGTTFTNAFYNIRFAGSGSWSFVDTQATTSNDFRIAQGTVTFPSGMLTIGGNFENTAGSFAHNSGTLKFSGTSAHSIDTNASFFNLLFSGAATSTFVDTNVTAEDLTILSGTVLFPTGTFSIGGSIANAGTITHNSGTVLLNSTDTGETIALGNSPLYNLTLNSATGGWTFTGSATTTASTTLTNAASFTLASGQSLSVGGVFTNSVGGASTTWTGSTLSLEAGTYSINTKTTGGDNYGTLLVKTGAAIKAWNSTSSVYTINGTGSLYSQDHNGVDGSLYIFGDYTRTSGAEYWNYATDFDGSALATSSRPVTVQFASGASASFTTSVLSIVGTTSASTTITNQGSGTYTVSVTGGTTTALFYDFRDLGTSGLSLLGANKVTSLTNGRFVPGIGAGTGITVSADTIDANPALQIYRAEFSTTTAISAANVTQTGGVPTSYWWFRESAGNIDGEAFDADTGDPGSIRWDDSSLSITVSGRVYAADGVTPQGGATCGTGNPVRIVVEGGATYDGACDGSGNYSIPGVVIVGDPTLTVFLNGAAGGERAVTVTKTPTADITNLDLIVNRVITRHEDVAPLTIDDMAAYDSSDDGDILFAAATGTPNSLITVPNTALMVWATSTFTPGGTVTLQSGGTGTTYDGSLILQASSTFTGAGTTTYAIGGSFTLGTGATFVPASSTVNMSATTSGKGIVSAANETIHLHNLLFSGVDGGWNLNGNLSLTGDLSLATGTLTGTGDITLANGSFSGNGLLSLGSGTTTLTVSNTLGGTQAWTFGNLVLGTGSTVGTTSRATTATTTILGKLTIGTAHFFDVFGGVLDLRGSGTVFVENGTFVESTSTVRYSGTSGANVLSTGYYNLTLAALGSSPTFTGTGLGIVVGNTLTVGGASTTTFTLDTNDPALDVNGDVVITANGTLVGSGSAVFTPGGNWINSGTYTASGGTVTFNSAGSASIGAGNSSFSTVVINGTGAFTITAPATTTGAFTLTGAGAFTVNTNVTLAVGGTFTNALGGAATTWTGSTLYLYGGGNYQINASTTNDVYSRVAIGSGTQIRMWNSSASTTDLASTASLYSQDHAAVDGDLYIYGAYTKTAGTDYWSYAQDFDGTALAGGSRAVTVKIASSTQVLYTGGGLSVLGTPTASTSIQNQGSGAYSLRIGGTASTTWSYYDITNLDVRGLTFSGTPTVHTLSYGSYTVSTASGTAITVGGTVITQNTAKTFTNNTFSTTTGIQGFNVTATGTTASSWRFTNHAGVIAGEAYDIDPSGDPGYIVWDNSSANITISGHVYSDEGSTISTACTGTTTDITLRVAGLTTYQTTCAPGTGAYAISGVTYSPGDSFVVYIDGRTEKAATVSQDPVTSISDLDLYENRVIVRHEGATALTIADMALWDSSDDVDIPFTAIDASPDTLTLPANRKLIVWTGKQFQPGGNVTLSGGGGGAAYDGTLELYQNAIFTATGAESHSVGGSLNMGTSSTLTAQSSTFTFTTAGGARTIDTNDQAFYNVTFNGSGSWTTPNTTFTIGGDLTITQGALTLPSATTTVAGSFLNTGGSFNQNGGWMYFTASGAKSIRTGGSSFGTTTFDGTGSWTYLDTNATSTGDFTIVRGALTAATGTITIGGNFINSGTFTHNNGVLRMISSRASTTINASTSDMGGITIDGTGTFVFTDPTEALAGSLTLISSTTTLPTSTLSIAGSLVSQGGAFIHSTGTVLMNSTDTGETIAPGTSSTFNNLTIAAPTGGYTITADATTTGNFSLTSATAFALQNGKSLGVQGVFTNLVGGAATTWASTTINIRSGTAYTINTKAAGGDVYNIINLGNNSDLRMWNSSATTTLSDVLSSMYSENNAAINGELYIYGNYTRTTGIDYWDAVTDFDGAAIAARAVTVRHAAGATSTFSGGTLRIVGTPSATTTITNQGTGTYSLNIIGGTLNAQNYAVRNVDASGMVLSGTTTITSIANGDFELAVNGGALITISSTTVNYNASAVITGMRFATTTAITGVNVALVGTTASAWTFTSHRGNLAGEGFDSDGVDACGSIRWDDSSCLLTEQTAYRWRNDDGGEGVPDSEWFDANWSKRKRITVANADATTYTDAVVEVTVPYDSDMQSDFDDLRITDGSGTTTLNFVRESYTASTEATLWVKIPTLTASANTTLYLYYGNGGATNGGVGTSTFSAYDDFEDGNITEYGGDSSLFTVNGSFAYQGSYGLKATNAGDRTTYGIYRTAMTVSQGQTIRFFDYISTTLNAGSDDEVCTLFGVQSPGTLKQNYGVCLEQFGTDRVSISRDVYDNDNDTNTILLATSSISYTTGWYEVEVKWGTNNVIAVSVYRDGSLVATTSATDATYTTGGVGFAYWAQHGGWDVYSARPLLTTEPTVTLGFEQVSGGATWAAAVNTKLSGKTQGETVRPRFVIENTGLQVSDQYTLMYADKGDAPSCESIAAGSYAAVPPQASCGTAPLCMNTSSQFSNRASTTDILGGDGTFTQGQIVEDPSNITENITLNSNYYTETEYAVILTTNAISPNYCLRISDNGTAIDSYTRVAELGLVFPPSITSITFNDGADITLSPGATTTIYATGTVTDLNGYSDIAAATTTMFRSGVSASCTADRNNCYVAGPSQCSYTSCAGNSCDIVCSADFYYFADPTDAGTYGPESWGAEMTTRDQSGLTSAQTAPYIDLLTLRAFSVSSPIDYGALSVNSDTGSSVATTTFTNIGNSSIDALLEGTDLTDGVASIIPVNEQKFATSTFTYSSCVYCSLLTASTTGYELDLFKPTSTSTVTDQVFWGIAIPYGVSAAPHYGTNTFYTTAD